MLETRMPQAICPICGHSLNAASPVVPPHRAPEPGDWTVCIGCAGVLKFDQALKVVVVPAQDVKRGSKRRPELAMTIKAVRLMHQQFGRPRETGKPN
jgi:hypothetical protein